MKWITAGDLKATKRRHCEETLPELVSRLICATATSITKTDFPTGDSVTTGGWDGYLETSVASPFFPKVVSGWEMGVEATPGKKADSNYSVRTKKPGGLNRAKSTFVFVTPRPWPKRKEWLVCPGCRRRCGRLYQIAGSEYDFRCRVCLGLAYSVQYRKSKSARTIRIVRKLMDEKWFRRQVRKILEGA